MTAAGHPTDEELIRVVDGSGLPSTIDHLHTCYSCAALVRTFVEDFFDTGDSFQSPGRDSGRFSTPEPATAGH